MRLGSQGHLTYCTNIHPGETWSEVRANLERFLPRVKQQVAPDRDVTKAGDKPTGDEAKAALDGHIAYFGKYSVDESARTVTHHRHGSVQPGDKGDVVRGYEFAGDRLILKPIGTTTEVLWERIK